MSKLGIENINVAAVAEAARAQILAAIKPTDRPVVQAQRRVIGAVLPEFMRAYMTEAKNLDLGSRDVAQIGYGVVASVMANVLATVRAEDREVAMAEIALVANKHIIDAMSAVVKYGATGVPPKGADCRAGQGLPQQLRIA